MAVVPKRLSFQLRFRNKTKTRKIVSRNFRLQKLLKKDSNNSNYFYYSLVKKEKHKDLLKKPYKQKSFFRPPWFIANKIKTNNNYHINLGKVEKNNLQLAGSQVNWDVLRSQKCIGTGRLPNKNKFLNNIFKPDYIFLKKKKVVSSKLRASRLLFGRYGVCFKQYSIISSKSVETAKLDIAKNLRKKGRFWIRICCDTPVSARPAETRMGKGKGSISYWAAKVSPGQLFFEFSGISLVQLKEIYQTLCKKSTVSLKTVY